MSEDNLLRCETCGVDIHNIETPIFEKPLRFALRSDIKQLEQNTGDQRVQENICLNCFTEKLKELSSDFETKYTVNFKVR